MARSTINPARTGFSRVFLIEGRAGPTHKPLYQANMKAGGISRGYGDIEKIEVPSPDKFDEFTQVAEIRGANERPTLSLVSRYALDVKSKLIELANKGCAFDVHVIFGSCSDPTDYNTFTKKIVLENVFGTSYSGEDLGALASDERAKIDETLDISAREFYEVVQISLAERAGDVVTNEVVDIIVCDTASCGDCGTESDGCEVIYGITSAAGGSPSTPADLVFSLDGGVNFIAHDIDTLSSTEDPTGVACLGAYAVVVSADSNSLHYIEKTELKAGSDPAFTEVSTGFVTGGGPLAIYSVGGVAFIVGNGGYIYKLENPADGVTVLDAGVTFPLGQLNDVHALSETFAVAVGNAGAIAKTENGETWSAVTPPVSVAVNLNTVFVKSELEWWVGASNGNLYYTTDGGDSWSTKSFTGSGVGQVRDIVFANDTVGYLSHSTAAPAGRLLRTTNGGYDWVVLPEGSGTIPANDYIGALAACATDPDFVVGGGLADNGTDGFVIVASS